MRPIRRFGTSSVLSDRLASRNLDKIGSSFSRQPWTSAISDKRRSNGLFYTNNYVQSEKENKKVDPVPVVENARPEIIISTPAFQLICDRRRTQPRNASADELAVSPTPGEKQLKSVLKKSPNGDVSPAPHRSRWTAFNRRSVSFADDRGLQLTEIKMFDLCQSDSYSSFTSFPLLNRQLASGFIADFILPPPYRRLRRLQEIDVSPASSTVSAQIVLESYTANRSNVIGVIASRKSISDRRVFVQYSCDNWATYGEADAVTVVNGLNKIDDPSIERYSFTLTFPPRPQIASRLEFKLGARTQNDSGLASPAIYWDDNNGSNYSFTFI